jgi:2,4-diketo-3-deoxy-L-fuconate hydrolase
MRFARRGPAGAEIPVVETRDAVFDLRPLTADIDGPFLAGDGVARTRTALDAGTLPRLDDAELRVGSPIAAPGKIVCIGLNYRDHAEETGAALPAEPVVFMKDPSTVVGPYDDVRIPRRSVKTDWEVELGVVIGTRARYVSQKEALNFVAGYCTINDVSEREYQIERGGTWDKGKGCDTFGPLGPWLVTRDDVPNPQKLAMWLDLNGKRVQTGSTRTMIFSVAKIVSYVSQFMTLMPGDVITTGTPPGVGMGMKPPLYLKKGDEMALGIEGLGEQRQQVVAFRR